MISGFDISLRVLADGCFYQRLVVALSWLQTLCVTDILKILNKLVVYHYMYYYSIVCILLQSIE